MKKKWLVLFGLCWLVITTGCNNDDSGNNDSSSADEVSAIAETGTWRITNFVDAEEDKTDQYNGFEFSFQENGDLVGSNSLLSIPGTWLVVDGGSDSTDDVDFNITFPDDSLANFAELTDDWSIVNVTSVRMELNDISSANGSTDVLIFEKN